MGGEPFVLPIDFMAALHLAQTANLTIAQARTVIDQYRALQQRANVTAIPNFVIGSEYIHHEGQLQKTEGNIETVNRDSLWVGGGPQMNFQFADAVFAPLVARRRLSAAQAGLRGSPMTRSRGWPIPTSMSSVPAAAWPAFSRLWST